jgi:alpha-beta hydrolase superfamily lysophospholipase
MTGLGGWVGAWQAMEDIQTSYEELTAPMLILQGEADTFNDLNATRSLFERSKSLVRPPSTGRPCTTVQMAV